jgi:hypothetical protein
MRRVIAFDAVYVNQTVLLKEKPHDGAGSATSSVAVVVSTVVANGRAVIGVAVAQSSLASADDPVAARAMTNASRIRRMVPPLASLRGRNTLGSKAATKMC